MSGPFVAHGLKTRSVAAHESGFGERQGPLSLTCERQTPILLTKWHSVSSKIRCC